MDEVPSRKKNEENEIGDVKKKRKEKYRKQEENNCSVNQVDLIDWSVCSKRQQTHTHKVRNEENNRMS